MFIKIKRYVNKILVSSKQKVSNKYRTSHTLFFIPFYCTCLFGARIHIPHVLIRDTKLLCDSCCRNVGVGLASGTARIGAMASPFFGSLVGVLLFGCIVIVVVVVGGGATDEFLWRQTYCKEPFR